MTWRSLAAAVLAACVVGLTNCPAAENSAKPSPDKAAGSSIEYVPLDAPAGMSQAVIVQGFPLVHTRQLLPLDREGKLVGEGSADQQIEQVLDNLEAVLKDSGSGLDKLVRVNVYALAPATVTRVREHLSKRLGRGGASGDHLGPDADAASQGAGGRRRGRRGRRRRQGRGAEALPGRWPATSSAPMRPCCRAAAWRISPASRTKAG